MQQETVATVSMDTDGAITCDFSSKRCLISVDSKNRFLTIASRIYEFRTMCFFLNILLFFLYIFGEYSFNFKYYKIATLVIIMLFDGVELRQDAARVDKGQTVRPS